MDLKEQLKKAMEDLEKLERKKEKFLADYDEKRKKILTKKKVQRDSEQIIKELVEERYRQKKTQQEMADITGVRASNIARFEGATCTPTLIMLEKYANALGKHIEIRVCEDK